MKNYAEDIKKYFSGIMKQSDGISIKAVRMSKFVYFAAYAFELMLFNARGLFLPFGVSLFGVGGGTVAQVFHGIASLLYMLLWKDDFRIHIKTAVVIMIAGFVPFVFLPYGYLKLVFGIIFYIGLGGAVTSARCGYAFALNNSERFIGMLITFFTVAFFKITDNLGAEGIIVTYILPFSLLAGLSVCLLKFKPQDFEVKEKSDRKDEKGIYWALAFFILYFSVDGYRASLVSSDERGYLYMCFGMLAVGVLLFVSLAVFKFSTWHMWNVFFFVCIILALFTGFTKNSETDNPLNFFGGMTFIGWPLSIYTLGCAQRKFASYSLLKKCTLIFVLASPLTTISSDIVYAVFPNYFYIITMIYLIAVSVIFLSVSPYSFNKLFSAMWIKEITSADMVLLEKKLDRFDSYSLTPRQKEIAVLLLDAKTRRQIAAELSISESTAKMHISDLYKKLGINSKAELFKMFGNSENEY